MSEILLCPKCKALVGKNLTRCYQCHTFLLGSRLEDFFLSLLPESYRKNPATKILFFLNMLPMAVLLLTVGFGALGIPSTFAMIQIGATNSALILMGQYWRFVTANFVHFGALHLLMNMLALSSLGPLMEQMYGYKKCFLLFFISGTLTFAAFMGVEFLFPQFFSSSVAGGASAGIFGFLGAGVAGAHKHAGRAVEFKRMLIKNFFINIAIGLAILPLGSNLLHIFGFAFGFVLAKVIPDNESTDRVHRKIFSYAFLLSVGLIVASFLLQGQEIKKYSLTVEERDFDTRIQQCMETEADPQDSLKISEERIRQAIYACETALREGLNYPQGVLSRLRNYARRYPTLLDETVLERDFRRMQKYLKPYRE